MSEEYPLYPSLTPEGEEEAQRIMDSFKPKIKQLVSDILGDIYTDVSMHVASDHWTNYRNQLMDGFKGYQQNNNHEHDFKDLRQAIYANHKDEIIKDLNQDMVAEIKKLNEYIVILENQRRY